MQNNKDWTEHFHLENGNYQNKCMNCNSFFVGYKRSILCRECYYKKNLMEEQLYFGLASFWEGGVNLAYSPFTEDILEVCSLIGLAGQDKMIVGTIKNIEAFKDLIKNPPIIKNENSSENSSKYYDLEIAYEKAALLIKEIKLKSVYTFYIDEDKIVEDFNLI